MQALLCSILLSCLVLVHANNCSVTFNNNGYIFPNETFNVTYNTHTYTVNLCTNSFCDQNQTGNYCFGNSTLNSLSGAEGIGFTYPGTACGTGGNEVNYIEVECANNSTYAADVFLYAEPSGCQNTFKLTFSTPCLNTSSPPLEDNCTLRYDSNMSIVIPRSKIFHINSSMHPYFQYQFDVCGAIACQSANPCAVCQLTAVDICIGHYPYQNMTTLPGINGITIQSKGDPATPDCVAGRFSSVSISCGEALAISLDDLLCNFNFNLTLPYEYCQYCGDLICNNAENFTSCPSDCNPVCTGGCNNGTCVADGLCNCTTGWKGNTTGCNTAICSGDCNGGTCTSPGICECPYGWTGNTTNCDTPICTGHCANGTCTLPGVCSCTEGWTGNITNCEDPICSGDCHGGMCILPGICDCPSGWTGNTTNCDTPVCTGGCNNGTCVGDDLCNCTAGWEGNTTGCTTPICTGHCDISTCTLPGVCSCYDGWTGNTTNCETAVCSGDCHGGKCVSPGICECPIGWTGNTSNCDIPVCTGGCNNGNCVGDELCNCTAGWEGNTTGCNTPICTGHCKSGTCTLPGVCSCAAGWTGNTTNCGNPVCSGDCHGGTCASPGICECPSGWTGNATNCNIPLCDPGCKSGTCTASHTCSCNAGWRGSTCNSTCGDGICDPEYETCVECSADCKSPCDLCGDSDCSPSESCSTCYQDCSSACEIGCVPSCSAQGTCKQGVCLCTEGWSGPTCSSSSNQPIVINVNNNTITVSTGNLSNNNFSISIKSIEELFKNGTAKTYYLDHINFTTSSYALGNTSNKFYNLSGHIISTISVPINIYIWNFEEPSTPFEYAGITSIVKANTLKIGIVVQNWPFESRSNKLGITFDAGVKSSETTCIQSGSNPYTVNWLVVTLDGISLYANLTQVAIIDGEVTNITYSRNGSLITATIPFFWEYTYLDPDYSVLLDTDKSYTIACNNLSNNSHSNKVIEIVVPIVVAFFVLVLVLFVLFYQRIATWFKVRTHKRTLVAGRGTEMNNRASQQQI